MPRIPTASPALAAAPSRSAGPALPIRSSTSRKSSVPAGSAASNSVRHRSKPSLVRCCSVFSFTVFSAMAKLEVDPVRSAEQVDIVLIDNPERGLERCQRPPGLVQFEQVRGDPSQLPDIGSRQHLRRKAQLRSSPPSTSPEHTTRPEPGNNNRPQPFVPAVAGWAPTARPRAAALAVQALGALGPAPVRVVVGDVARDRGGASLTERARWEICRRVGAELDSVAAVAGEFRSRPYLWGYTWRHCADAEQDGLAALRRLVKHDHDLALALDAVANTASARSRPAAAMASIEEAVTRSRALAADSPAFAPNLAASLSNFGIRYTEVGDARRRWRPPRKPSPGPGRWPPTTPPSYRTGPHR